MSDVQVTSLLQAAANAQRAGQTGIALQHFHSILAREPANPVALNSLGVHALGTGDVRQAADLFRRAIAVDAKAGGLWLNLAKAQRLLGDNEGERASLAAALDLDQTDFMALIRLAELHQRLGEDAQAAARWTAVLALASAMPGSNPELQAMLASARSFVDRHSSGFASHIDRELGPVRDGIAGAPRRRFDACVDALLGRRKIYANHCEGIFYPFLPADEFFDRGHFPWLETLEAASGTIRREAAPLLAGNGTRFVPYVSQAPGTPPNKWTALDRSDDWGAYYLWQFGIRNDAACAACPQTAAIVEALPLARIDGRAPTIFFSLLRPGTRIPPHTGVTNTRAIVHLPLIIPEGCGFRVGGETRKWQFGEAFVFDDTIEHEAWNESDEARLVLICDVWNPHLSAEECGLLRAFHKTADASGFNPEGVPKS